MRNKITQIYTSHIKRCGLRTWMGHLALGSVRGIKRAEESRDGSSQFIIICSEALEVSKATLE